MLSYNCVSIRGTVAKRYMRNLQKDIPIACNKQVYNATKNKAMYDCLSFNSTDNCKHLENFTEYQVLRKVCIDSSNNGVALGILITVIGWTLVGMCFH